MRFLAIFKAVTKNWMRSKSGLFFSILFPIMLLLVFGFVFSGTGGSSRTTIYCQNLDLTTNDSPTDLSKAFITAINSTEFFNINDIPSNVDALGYARNMTGPFGGTIRILVIPAGFQDDVLNGTLKNKVSITYGTLNDFTQYLPPDQQGDIQQGIQALELFNSSLTERNATLLFLSDPTDQSAGIAQSVLMSVADAFNYQLIGAKPTISFKSEDITVRQLTNVDYYLPGIIAAFIMTNGVIGVTTNSTEFKRRGIIKRLATTPLTKFDWIMGTILSQTVLNLLLTGVMVVVGWIVFGVTAIPDAFALILIFLGSIMFSGIGMILSGFIKDVEAASAAGNAITFPMMFLSGTYWPIEFMPSFLQAFSRVLPLTYFSDGLRAAMISQYMPGIIFNTAVIGVLAAVFIVLGVLTTSWKEK